MEQFSTHSFKGEYMMSKFKRKKVDLPKEQEPRSIEELQKLYQELCAKLGNSQYLASVHTQDCENLKRSIAEVNQEASRRQALDQQALQAQQAKPAEAQQGASSEQA